MKCLVFQMISLLLIFPPLKAQENGLVPLRKWGSEEERLQERQRLSRLSSKLDTFLRQKQEPIANIVKSSILPGYGQFAAKKSLKGLIFTTTALTTIGGGIYFLRQSNQKYDKYKSADNIDDIEKYFDGSEKLLKTSRTYFGIGVAIWALNIIDAYFSTNSYNKKQFEKFYYAFAEKKLGLNANFGMQGRTVTIGLAYRF